MTHAYQCPGEPYPISHAVHLGRLASFYPNCRHCPHRTETGQLTRALVKQLAVLEHPDPQQAQFTDEAIVGIYRNQLSPAGARDYAAAFGSLLRQQLPDMSRRPRVIIAGDERPLSPELIAAAGEGLRWSGCHVIDIGSATTACLTLALDEMQADGGLLVGNPQSDPHWAGLKLWGANARPLSAGSDFDQLQNLLATGLDRPTRSYGGFERRQTEASYLKGLVDYFHALRPLRLVLDTGCRPLVRFLKQLTASVGCDIGFVQDQPHLTRLRSPRMTPKSGQPGRPRHAIPIERFTGLSRQVHEREAHLGLWIDGDGEVCHAIDEQGHAIPAEHLLVVVARYLLAEQPASSIVLEQDTPAAIQDLLHGLGAQVTLSGSLRAEMDAALRASGSFLGGGPSGRFWYASPLPLPDGLKTLALLLTILSQSDRPLSEVVAESLEPVRLIGYTGH